LPGKRGDWGGIATDNRLFINAVFRILRTGALWRDLLPVYGDWKNTHRRFSRWRDNGIWATTRACASQKGAQHEDTAVDGRSELLSLKVPRLIALRLMNL
jgi:transposase